MAKILFFDIEATNLDADFGKCLCFGYKWQGQKETQIISVLDFAGSFEHGKVTDAYVVKAAAKIISEADMLVSWYGKRFDVPFINTRLLKHQQKPLPVVPHCDGWEISRYKLRLHSNRLASISAFLGIEEKTPLKPDIWGDASTGHRPSIKYVIEHCLQDVVVLEEAYELIKPWASTHPNVGLMNEKITPKPDDRPTYCTVCGSKGKMTAWGYYIAEHTRKHRYVCTTCGNWAIGKVVKLERP